MIDVDLSAPWAVLGRIDPTPLAVWLGDGHAVWPAVKGGQPNRVGIPPESLDLIALVLRWFPPGTDWIRATACISRLVPGQNYEYHQDQQPPNWLTRVHVPVVTNHGAWFAWQPKCERVHFEVGSAYSFNTMISHAFGNDGLTDRVHLTFDLVRNGSAVEDRPRDIAR